MKPQSFDPNACGLKKRNYSRKVISELEDDEGEITKEKEQILLKIENYYRDLYTSKIDVTEEQFNVLNLVKSGRDGAVYCEKVIILNPFFCSLNNLSSPVG